MNTETIKSTEVLAPTTERISGSEAVIKCLLAEGVDILYGYPGGAIMPVYDELYKSLDDDVGQDAENEEICLITNMPLTDTHFKMQCGHKFNYKPLFLDIKNHKQKFNVMEGSGSKLGQHQIRCPYCRSKHTGTLYVGGRYYFKQGYEIYSMFSHAVGDSTYDDKYTITAGAAITW